MFLFFCHFPRLLPVPNIELSGKCQNYLNGSYLKIEDFPSSKLNLRGLKAIEDISETVLVEINVNNVIHFFVLLYEDGFSSWALHKGTSVSCPRQSKIKGNQWALEGGMQRQSRR